MKILQVPCVRGACLKALLGGSWGALVSRFRKIRSKQRYAFFGDLAPFSEGSWQEDLGQGLLQVLVRSSCGDPSEMPSGDFA
jgi:hypothetical protein